MKYNKFGFLNYYIYLCHIKIRKLLKGEIIMIHDVINIHNLTICYTEFHYEVKVSINDKSIIRKAKKIDKNFNRWNFYVEITIISGIPSYDGFYFYNSNNEKQYIIVELSQLDWECIKGFVRRDYCRR